MASMPGPSMRGGIRLALALPLTLVVTLVVTLLVSCATSSPPCYRGEYRGCSCTAPSNTPFTSGYQACNVTEDGFQACVCDGRTPGVDGGRDAAASDAAPGPALGGYLTSCASAPCTEPGNICFEFGMKGQRCTKRCTLDSDCPPPSPGCNPKSVCKLP